MVSDLRHFHEGEARLQAESGVDSEAFDDAVAEAFRPELTANEQRFVAGRTFSVAATIDERRRPWASALFGRKNELFSVIESTTVKIDPVAVDGDPFRQNVSATGELGVLYFDPSRRRRAKSLGNAVVDHDGRVTYRMNRNFGLCTKYIFKREHEAADDRAHDKVAPERRSGLDQHDRDQLSDADTIFLASHHEEHGTDATHRGGPAGFITVVDDTTVSLPDYVGNGMFQTLGNLLLDDRIGVLALDFGSGRSLHLTGTGSIVESPLDDVLSERTLVIHIDEVLVTWPTIGHWTDIEAFPIRPGLVNPGTPTLR